MTTSDIAFHKKLLHLCGNDDFRLKRSISAVRHNTPRKTDEDWAYGPPINVEHLLTHITMVNKRIKNGEEDTYDLHMSVEDSILSDPKLMGEIRPPKRPGLWARLKNLFR